MVISVFFLHDVCDRKSYIVIDPKFSARQVLANSVDPYQTAHQGLHCLPFPLHLLDAGLYDKTTLFKFENNYSNFSGVRIMIFTGI